MRSSRSDRRRRSSGKALRPREGTRRSRLVRCAGFDRLEEGGGCQHVYGEGDSRRDERFLLSGFGGLRCSGISVLELESVNHLVQSPSPPLARTARCILMEELLNQSSTRFNPRSTQCARRQLSYLCSSC